MRLDNQKLILFLILLIAAVLLSKQLPSTFKAAVIPRVPGTRFQPSRQGLSRPKTPSRDASFLRLSHDVARAKTMHQKFNFNERNDPR